MVSTVKHSLIGGILAGMVFAMMEMVYGAFAKGSFFAPLKMIASLPLQQPPPQIPLGSAIVVGLITHMVFSMMFGLIAAVIISQVPSAASSQSGIVIAASVVGLMLWPLNFYVIAPLLHAPWFATQTDWFWQGLVAHTIFFGTVLGMYLASRLPKAAAMPEGGSVRAPG
ncbi:MAG TPA: hypothetical protein VMW65_03235 [Chloroflexota bacterium]|nr:hypothetical protein [Chloroflexota bacterium]